MTRRIALILKDAAEADLKELVENQGFQLTDAMNRAISLYARIHEAIRNGGGVYIRQSADADLERVWLL